MCRQKNVISCPFCSNKCAKVWSHIARPKTSRTHAHFAHFSKWISHAPSQLIPLKFGNSCTYVYWMHVRTKYLPSKVVNIGHLRQPDFLKGLVYKINHPPRLYLPSLYSGITVWQSARSLKNSCTLGSPRFTSSSKLLS